MHGTAGAASPARARRGQFLFMISALPLGAYILLA